jgi:hypothetical protein
MSPAITLACIVFIPIAVVVALRVNATLVFLSLCLGDVLAQFVSTQANSLTGVLSSSHITANIHPTDSGWKIALIVLPVIATTLIMIHTIKGNSKVVLNLFPAAGLGLVGALLIVPLLPPAAAQGILENTLWQQLINVQGIIVGVSALACLIFLWMQRPKPSSGKHGKHGD